MGVAPPPPAPLDPSYKPTVFLAELPADAPIEDILKILDRDGGVILTNFTSTEDLATLKKDTLPYWEGPLSKGTQVANLIPPETTLVHGLVGKSKVATRICEHPTLDMLRRNILEYQFTQNREGVIDKHRIDPLLSLSLTLNIGHGAPRQHLHRDDYIFGVKHDKTFELNQSEQLGCLIAGVRTTRENGATMVVPGSHRWDDSRQPRLDEITFAGMSHASRMNASRMNASRMNTSRSGSLADVAHRNGTWLSSDLPRERLPRRRRKRSSQLHAHSTWILLHKGDSAAGGESVFGCAT